MRAIAVFTSVIACILSWDRTCASAGQGDAFHRNASQSPICGLLCVQAAIESCGVPAPSLQQLVKGKYLSGVDGSSADDLATAIRDSGVDSAVLRGLSSRSLLGFNGPALLRIENHAAATRHWVLYCGADGDGYLLADLPSPPEKISEADLNAMWSGTAVVVGKPAASALRALTAWLVLNIVPLLAVPLILILAAGHYFRQLDLSFFKQAVVIASIVVMLAGYRHCVMADGFFHNRQALQSVGFRYLPDYGIHYFSSRDGMPGQSLVFIDARYPAAFRAGHIPGAFNLPTYATKYERLRALHGISHDTQLAVYCESDRCPYADIVARSLILDGFEHVTVYTGGWRDWNAGELARKR